MFAERMNESFQEGFEIPQQRGPSSSHLDIPGAWQRLGYSWCSMIGYWVDGLLAEREGLGWKSGDWGLRPDFCL